MPVADELIGVEVATRLHSIFVAANPEANLSALAHATTQLQGRPLKERSDLLRDGLLAGFPDSYAALATGVRAAAASPALTEWMIWPVTSAVAERAVAEASATTNATANATADTTASAAPGETAAASAAHAAVFDDAMALLAELTGRLTAEFAIRALLRHDLNRALKIATGWTASPDEHIRRLASEGTRAYLPWGAGVPALIRDPAQTLPILDALYRDESEYVRRSVANHLNDMSRHAPDLVIATATRWIASPGPHTPRNVKHALRTLIKRGDPRALELLGFAPAQLTVSGPALSETTVQLGETVTFTTTVRNDGSARAPLAIDYLVHHTKANGAQTAKVFKLKSVTLAPGETLTLNKSHSFRPISTRRYYPGTHAIELQVNGVRHGRAEFALVE